MELFREKKSAFNAVHFYVIFFACCLPNFFFTILLTTDSSQISFWLTFHLTFIFVLFNSSLIPLVYCWRYREIRQIMKSTAKNLILERITKASLAMEKIPGEVPTQKVSNFNVCISTGPKAERKWLKRKILSVLFIRFGDRELVLKYGGKSSSRIN